MNCKDCLEQMWPEDPRVGAHDWRLKRYLSPICQGCPNEYRLKELDIEDRIGNLEAISAQPGRIPRQYYDQLQQLQGELAHLKHKLFPTAPAHVKPSPHKRGVKID